MKRTGLLAALALSLVGFAGSAKADLVIDSFATNPVIITQATVGGTNTSIQTGIATTDVIGGTRNLKLTVTAGNGTRQAVDEVDTTDSTFNISNAVGVTSTSTLLYDANGAGLGGIDLTAFGDGIAFDVLQVDLNVSITITLVSQANVVSTQTLPNLLEGVATFSFTGFSVPAVATSVKSIQITFNTPNSADLTGSLLRVATVPEPSSVFALGMGAVMMGGFAIRRRRAAQA